MLEYNGAFLELVASGLGPRCVCQSPIQA